MIFSTIEQLPSYRCSRSAHVPSLLPRKGTGQSGPGEPLLTHPEAIDVRPITFTSGFLRQTLFRQKSHFRRVQGTIICDEAFAAWLRFR